MVNGYVPVYGAHETSEITLIPPKKRTAMKIWLLTPDATKYCCHFALKISVSSRTPFDISDEMSMKLMNAIDGVLTQGFFKDVRYKLQQT